MKAKRSHPQQQPTEQEDTVMDILERLKWGDPALYRSLLFFIALAALALGYLYWETTGRAQDAEAALSAVTQQRDEALAELATTQGNLATVTTEHDEANTRISELEEELATTKGNLATVTTEHDEANTRIGELDEKLATVTQELDDANIRIGELEAENKTLHADNENLRDDNETLKTERDMARTELATVTTEREEAIVRIGELEAALAVWSQHMEIVNGERPINELYPIAVLLGERVNRPVPNPDVYESTGIVTLSRGVWAFAVRGLGGDTQTGAGNHKLELNPVSVNCWQEATGRWDRAYEVTCDSLQVGWEIQSRYPYASFAILPIDPLIPSEDE